MRKKDRLYLRKARAYNALSVGYLIGGEDELAKQAIGTMIVFSRLRAREAVNRCRIAEEAHETARRSIILEKRMDVSDEDLDLLNQLRTDYRNAKNELANVGHELSLELRSWETSGATLRDLCNLCNRDYAQITKKITPNYADLPFDLLVAKLLLDYKAPYNHDSAISMDIDAPLTHAILEFEVHAMLEMPGLNEKYSNEFLEQLDRFVNGP